VFLRTFSIILFCVNTSLSFSQTQTESYLKTEAVNKVQFVAVEDGYLVFDLLFSELPLKGCSLRILDDADDIIFEELITGNSYLKRYRIERNNMTKISFRMAAKGFSFNQAFIIKKEEKIYVLTE
jgi:hypothetical protein